MTLRRITARDRPERIAQRTASCQERLTAAVTLAAKRAARSVAPIRVVLESAIVEGIPSGQRIKAGVVSFGARPLQTLHLFWPWHTVERSSDSELATWIAMTVRRSLKEKERHDLARRDGSQARHARSAQGRRRRPTNSSLSAAANARSRRSR